LSGTSGRQGTQQPLRSGRSYPILLHRRMYFLIILKDIGSCERTEVLQIYKLFMIIPKIIRNIYIYFEIFNIAIRLAYLLIFSILFNIQTYKDL
jgi:hypothetical protein